MFSTLLMGGGGHAREKDHQNVKSLIIFARDCRDYKFQNLPFSAFCHTTPPPLSSTLHPWMSIDIYVEQILSGRELLKACSNFQAM